MWCFVTEWRADRTCTRFQATHRFEMAPRWQDKESLGGFFIRDRDFKVMGIDFRVCGVDSHAHDGKALVAHLHSTLSQPEAKPILRQPPAHIKFGIHLRMLAQVREY